MSLAQSVRTLCARLDLMHTALPYKIRIQFPKRSLSNDCANPREPQAKGPDHHRSDSASSHLLESAALFCGVRGALRFGRDQVRPFPEEREREVARLGALPHYLSGDMTRIAVGGEHIVHRTADSLRIVKITLPGVFGRIVDEDWLFDSRTFLNSWKLKLRDALPSEYYTRWALLDVLFGLQTQFEGIHQEDGHEPQLVISQPFIGEFMPDLEDVEALMKAMGFEKVDAKHIINPVNGDCTWYRQRDGLLITDAFPRNFRLDREGAIIPIDLMINIVPPGASKILPPATEPFTLPADASSL